MAWLKENIVLDEQLGFRRNHSCLEHALLVYLIAENRQLLNKDTFCFNCFIDLKKAFDSVNSNLLCTNYNYTFFTVNYSII